MNFGLHRSNFFLVSSVPSLSSLWIIWYINLHKFQSKSNPINKFILFFLSIKFEKEKNPNSKEFFIRVYFPFNNDIIPLSMCSPLLSVLHKGNKYLMFIEHCRHVSCVYVCPQSNSIGSKYFMFMFYISLGAEDFEVPIFRIEGENDQKN